MVIGFVQTSGYHHILWLQQSSHHIEHGGLSDVQRLLEEEQMRAKAVANRHHC